MSTTPEPTLTDLLLALRYAYYVECAPVVSDQDYDVLEQIADRFFYFEENHGVGSDLASSYTEEQKALAKLLRKRRGEK